MFTITKTFDFEYAHRVYTQDVSAELSYETKPENTCRHLHGHSGKLTVALKADALDHRGFVLDYKELGFVKKIVQEFLDHKTIIGFSDPLREEITGRVSLEKTRIHNILVIDSSFAKLKDYYDGYTIINCIPTSEAMAKFFYNVIETELLKAVPTGISLDSVSWSETPSSTATYSQDY